MATSRKNLFRSPVEWATAILILAKTAVFAAGALADTGCDIPEEPEATTQDEPGDPSG